MMVTECDSDHFVFNLEMFKHNTNKKTNFLDKHQKLIDAKRSDMLLHPVMTLFTNLKWYPHKTWYYTNFSIFLVFLLLFTFHTTFCVDIFQCKCDQLKLPSDLDCAELNKGMLNGYQYSNHLDCEDKLRNIYKVTKYSTWIFLSLLSGLEVIQFLGNVINKQCKQYVSVQNFVEVLMLCSSQTFFVLDHFEHDSQVDVSFLGSWVTRTGYSQPREYTVMVRKVPVVHEFLTLTV